jgi:uncharacterized secreted protein with C-terminal beta-propeller domain
MTEILSLRYGAEGFEKLGGTVVEGTVKNQYSLDEYNGTLRVVTTLRNVINYYVNIEGGDGEEDLYEDILDVDFVSSNAALYCIDLETFEVVAEVSGFAPDGESVESVRFDGTKAYVCTAEVITFTDPVYFFDLSDMSNITYTDTGVIDGFSSTLIQLGDGFLLGIGEESLDKGKIEVYAEMDGQVVSVAKYVFEGWYTTEYKSYFIDRESKTVGIPVSNFKTIRNEYGYDYVWYIDGYLLFTFDEENYSTRIIEKEWYNELERVRAFADDGYLYITTDMDITVKKIIE